MSNTAQGSGWWQASDGKWYPPDARPGVEQQPGSAGAGWAGAPGAQSPGWGGAQSPGWGAPQNPGSYGQGGWVQPFGCGPPGCGIRELILALIPLQAFSSS